MSESVESMGAAQTPTEAQTFVEAFARVTVKFIRDSIGQPLVEAAAAEQAQAPDWDSEEKLTASGLTLGQVDEAARAGRKYLHIDAAAAKKGKLARELFLGLAGLSAKQRRAVFPLLSSSPPYDPTDLSAEVARLNHWLDETRAEGFNPSHFVAYQRALAIHGQTQNLSGAIGAAGAAIAFVDAIREWMPDAIVDTVGEVPPDDVRSPSQIYDWQRAGKSRTLKALLLKNGRAVVFASSKDANIFMPLEAPFSDAKDALRRFNIVAKDQRRRQQQLHEFAVGEVKTATDKANLHERMGLASRETQTELRTDRFLMMAVLNVEILTGGTQKRVMNNKDLTRFTHVFNLHHCWGWDGGRDRNAAHWTFFKQSLKEWCGL